MDQKPKVYGLSQAVELEVIHPVMGTSSLWLASKVPEMQHRLFLQGGGKYSTNRSIVLFHVEVALFILFYCF